MHRRPFVLFFCYIFLMTMVITGLIPSGCSVEKNAESDPEDVWQGIITLWDFPRWPDKSGNRFVWIEKKIKEFEKAHPGVFIHLRPLKWGYGLIELRAAAAAGTYPDIAPLVSQNDFILEGYLEPVDEFFKPDDLKKYEPRAIEAVTYQGQIYGFPWFMTTYGLFLNKDIFNARNATLPQNGSWSYDEFVQALQKVTYDKNVDGKIDYYGFNLFLSPASYQIWAFLTMDGAKIFDEQNNFMLNTPEGVSALTKLVNLEAKYKLVPTEEYGTLEETKVWDDFCEKQKIAVYPAGPWAIKVLRDRYDSGNGFEFDLVNYPKGESNPSGFVLVSGYAIFKQENEAKKAICADFLKFITSEDEQGELDKYSVFPVYTELVEKTINDPLMKRMKEILDTSVNLPKIRNWNKIDEEVIAQIRLALLSQKSPSEALEDAAKAVEIILAGSR
ncbi:MAG: sugar ABC transporter substrate-binding protein [Tepidanaerobacteraceae bacterium]|nr:sugar ABC transporter substrate-binding protein [Tepidanaerobacteraceae bacterium]